MRGWAVLGVLLLTGALSACGDTAGGTSTGGGGGGDGAAGPGGGTTTSTADLTCAPGVGLPDTACTPKSAACHPGTNPCLAVHENGGASQFHLRISQLGATKPAALTNTTVAAILEAGFAPDLAECYQTGDGTISWILSFDLAAGTLRAGAAKPPATSLTPYQLVTENIPGLDAPIAVAPSSAPLDTGGACQFASAPIDVNLPMYLTSGQQVPGMLIPLRGARFSGRLDESHSCIGSYNATSLDPVILCEPDKDIKRFTPRGTIKGLISLKDADNVNIPTLARSLCAFLTGESSERCSKDAAGNILAKGDACLATGQPAAPGCEDALFFEADFAASGVEVAP